MKKKFVLMFLFLPLLFTLTGCIQKTGEVDKVTVQKPKDDNGSFYTAKDLEFYLPTVFLKSPYNGMLGVYEFYTGEIKNDYPTEIDITILVDTVDDEFNLEEYAEKDASGVKDKITYRRKNINDHEWYIGNDKKNYYYCSFFNGNKYDIKISKNKDTNNIYDEAVSMFQSTLFFTENEVK